MNRAVGAVYDRTFPDRQKRALIERTYICLRVEYLNNPVFDFYPD